MSSSIFTKTNLTQQNTQQNEQSQNVEVSERYFADGDYITDMHVHTCHSHEGTFYMTPREYMDRAVKVAKENHCKVRLSFADHQSVFGSKEAMILKQKYPEKYKDVEVVSGIEINVSLEEINKKVKTGGRYTACHLLVYNYDVNDKELNAFSKLFYYSRKGAPYMGAQILAIRNILKEYGLKVKYSAIYDFYKRIENLSNRDMAKAFTHLLVVKRKIEKSQFKIVAQRIYQVLVIKTKSTKNDDKFRAALKVSLTDFKKMVKRSGGKVVLAHPCYLQKKGPRVLSRMQMIYEITDLLKGKLGKNLIGMEIFYPEQFKDGRLLKYLHMCEKFNLYPTCGSDCHGPNKTKSTDEFLVPVDYSFQALLSDSNEDLYASINNYVTNLKIFDYLKTGKHAKDRQEFDFVNKNHGKMTKEDLQVPIDKMNEKHELAKQQNRQAREEKRLLHEQKKHKLFLPIVVDNSKTI